MKAGVKAAAGASARIEEWRRAGDALRAELAATRDRLARELEEAENALAELDGRPAVPEKHQRREPKLPALSLPAVAPVVERQRRKRGTGGVVRNGKGWHYRIGAAGSYRYGKTFPTKEEAFAQLDAFLAGEPVASAKASEPKPAPVVAPAPATRAETGNGPWLSLGPGWGPADENGLAKHLSCSGRGTVSGNRCAGCEGQGYGRAKLRRSAA